MLTVRDVTAIQRILAEEIPLTDELRVIADVNGDGTVNIDDATCLQMYLAEYEVAIGKQS